jgi:hypothetical protein
MKRIALLAGGLALTALLLPGQSGRADSTKGARTAATTQSAQTPRPSACCCSDEDVVQELIVVMNEAKSPMTLVMAVTALEPMGKKARPAIPAIIRNAERLKVMEGLQKQGPQSLKAELAGAILDAIEAIQTGNRTNRAPVCSSLGYQRRWQVPTYGPVCAPMTAPPAQGSTYSCPSPPSAPAYVPPPTSSAPAAPAVAPTYRSQVSQ